MAASSSISSPSENNSAAEDEAKLELPRKIRSYEVAVGELNHLQPSRIIVQGLSSRVCGDDHNRTPSIREPKQGKLRTLAQDVTYDLRIDQVLEQPTKQEGGLETSSTEESKTEPSTPVESISIDKTRILQLAKLAKDRVVTFHSTTDPWESHGWLEDLEYTFDYIACKDAQTRHN